MAVDDGPELVTSMTLGLGVGQAFKGDGGEQVGPDDANSADHSASIR